VFLKGLAEELKKAFSKSIDLGMEELSSSMGEFTKAYNSAMTDMAEGETTKTVVESFSDGHTTKTVTRTVTTTVVTKTCSETTPEVNPNQERKRDE
jgi:ribosomal protein L11